MSTPHRQLGHLLAEGNRRCLDDAAAGRAGRRAAGLGDCRSDPVELVAELAGQALGKGSVAMKLDDAFGFDAREAVKVVDILGDDVGDPSFCRKPCDGPSQAGRSGLKKR